VAFCAPLNFAMVFVTAVDLAKAAICAVADGRHF
jgi:hypothetical protein